MIRRTEDSLDAALEQIVELEETVRDIAVKPSQANDSANRSAMLYHRLNDHCCWPAPWSKRCRSAAKAAVRTRERIIRKRIPRWPTHRAHS